jgi:secondary thiamine-phosphate synthase enzyme
VKHRFENHDLTTESCGQFIDITDDVLATVERSGVVNGQALVYSPHTTCAVLINELETGFIDDFCDFLDDLVPRNGNRAYRHDTHDGEEFPNGHSHVRTALLSSTSQTIPIVDSKPLLGTYQRVFFCELDRARERKVFIQVTGE